MIQDRYGHRRYKVSLHLHTTLSDGAKTPQEVIEEFKADGYDAIALTDHWLCGESRFENGLLVLSGGEYNVAVSHDVYDTEMHILGIGMKGMKPLKEGEATRQQAVDEILAAGGIPILAHPHWSLNSVEDAKALRGVTITEIYNSVSNAHESTRPYSGYFVDLCANQGLCYQLIATDDAHFYDGSDARKSWIMVRADELSEESLLAAIRRGDYYATQGPELHVRRDGDRLEIDCSPCSIIATLSNQGWAPNRVLRGENLTHFTYQIYSKDRWVRVEVTDADGRRAWSHVIDLKG